LFISKTDLEESTEKEIVLKGHGFSRAAKPSLSKAALAAEGTISSPVGFSPQRLKSFARPI
jgi:hypothetical protein